MLIYHVTNPNWIQHSTDRLGFRYYKKAAAHESFHDHKPLNDARNATPGGHTGGHTYATFFFSSEKIATEQCFQLLTWRPHVILRADSDHPSLSGFQSAKDDRDGTEGAHMWFKVDKEGPIEVRETLIHPTWGIPFNCMQIKTKDGGSWGNLTDYSNR